LLLIFRNFVADLGNVFNSPLRALALWRRVSAVDWILMVCLWWLPLMGKCPCRRKGKVCRKVLSFNAFAWRNGTGIEKGRFCERM